MSVNCWRYDAFGPGANERTGWTHDWDDPVFVAAWRAATQSMSTTWWGCLGWVFNAADIFDESSVGVAPDNPAVQVVYPDCWDALAILDTPELAEARSYELALDTLPGGPAYDAMDHRVRGALSRREGRVLAHKWYQAGGERWLITPAECHILAYALDTKLSRVEIAARITEHYGWLRARGYYKGDPATAPDDECVDEVLAFAAWMRDAAQYGGFWIS